jgi:hypothetical protein
MYLFQKTSFQLIIKRNLMKRKLLFMVALMAFIGITSISSVSMSQVTMVTDSVSMGQGYANEIYYNMSEGFVSSFQRNSWDFAIRTRVMSSSILTNDGTGVILYTYPKADTSGWATLDTTGMKSWKAMYNDPGDWENGAFSRNATGGLDFGWGIYNTNSHFITGDSLFVMQLRDGSIRKLWIEVKKAAEDIVSFRYAKIDGSEEQNITLDCNPYVSKDFIGYSLITNEIVDYQPYRSSWDILFTKYMSVQPGESGKDTVYPVTGVLNNDEVYSEKFVNVPAEFTGYNPDGWDSTRSSIGYNWKSFTGSGYVIADSVAYFVKTKAGDVYKLVFTKFAGSSSGKIIFSKGMVAGVGINDNTTVSGLQVFPNPVKEKMEIWFPEPLSGSPSIFLYDLSGRLVYQRNIPASGTKYSISVTGLNPGMYLLKVSSEKDTFLKKIIISR